MKKVLVIVMLIFAFGCSDDGTNPSENELVGEWMYNNTPQGIFEKSYIVLEFKEDGEFIKNQLTFGVGEANIVGTYSINNDIIVLESYECGPIEGKYKFEFRDNGVEFTLIEDECEKRDYVVYFFEKVEGPIVSPNPIVDDVRD